MKISLLAATFLATTSHVAAQQGSYFFQCKKRLLQAGVLDHELHHHLTSSMMTDDDDDDYELHHHLTSSMMRDDVENDYVVLPSPWRGHGHDKSIIMEADKDMVTYGKVELSPNGLTLAMAYPLGDINGDIRGYTVGTFAYVANSKQWAPLGKPFELGQEKDDNKQILMADTAMGSTCLVVSEQRGNFEDNDDIYNFSGKVHLYKHWDGVNGAFWGKIKHPIESDHEDEDEFFGFSVAVSEQVMNEDESEIVVAVGSLANFEGRVQVYQYQWHPENSPWSKVGGEIVGGGYPYFGQSIKFSEDGTILAVLGSYPGGDGDFTGMICLIRVYQLKQGDWKQIGQDITRDDEEDDLTCSNFQLSADGMTVASGGRVYMGMHKPPTGHVRVWSFDSGSSQWIKKGVDLDNLIGRSSLILPFSRNNGYTIGGNLGLVSNTAGTQLALSVCEWYPSPTSRIVQSMLCFILTFAWANDAKEWQQVGGPLDLPSKLINTAITPDGSVLAVGMLDSYGHFVAQSFDWHKTNGDHGGKAGSTTAA